MGEDKKCPFGSKIALKNTRSIDTEGTALQLSIFCNNIINLHSYISQVVPLNHMGVRTWQDFCNRLS